MSEEIHSSILANNHSLLMIPRSNIGKSPSCIELETDNILVG